MSGLSADGVKIADEVSELADYLRDGLEPAELAGVAVGVVATLQTVTEIGTNPIGALFAAGFGMIIEQTPLQELLDAVAGDADEVLAAAASWTDVVAPGLAGAAGEIGAAAANSTEWIGTAGDAFRDYLGGLDAQVAALAAAADSSGAGLATIGAVVGEVRKFIRDELADLLAWLVVTQAAAAAAALPTLGASEAAWQGNALARALLSSARISEVLTKLSRYAERVTGLAADVARALERLGFEQITQAGTLTARLAEIGAKIPEAALMSTAKVSTKVIADSYASEVS